RGRARATRGGPLPARRRARPATHANKDVPVSQSQEAKGGTGYLLQACLKCRIGLTPIRGCLYRVQHGPARPIEDPADLGDREPAQFMAERHCCQPRGVQWLAFFGLTHLIQRIHDLGRKLSGDQVSDQCAVQNRLSHRSLLSGGTNSNLSAAKISSSVSLASNRRCS